QICAEVCHYAHLQPEHGAVAFERKLGRHGLVAALNRGDEIFAARRDPLYRPAQLERQMTGEHILAVKRTLAAETAAHVWRDDANLVLRKAEPGRQITAHAVRRLGRKPNGES